jgi:hypothetical protein
VASYSGDSNNLSVTTKCGEANESSVVNKAQPGITTKAVTPVTVGERIKDTATLSGLVEPDGFGKVTFKAYSKSDCTDATPLFESTNPSPAGIGANGEVESGEYTTTAPGTVYWVASYSGDSNNLSVTTKCGEANEISVVNQLPSTISTTQSWTPQDTATIDHSGGSVVFTLFKNDPTCSQAGDVVYGPTSAISVVGSGPFTASTSNSGVSTLNGGFSVSSVAEGDTYHWKAAYTSGDANHKNVTSSCQESTGLHSLTNGSSVTSQ